MEDGKYQNNFITRIFRNASTSWLITLFIIFMLFYATWGQKEKFKALFMLSWEQLFVLIMVSLVATIFSTLPRKLMAQSIGINLDWMGWYGLSMVSNMLALVVPLRGDLVVTAIYLNKKYNMPITSFGSILYGNALIAAIVLVFEALICLLLIGILKYTWPLKVWGLIILMILALTILFFIPNKAYNNIRMLRKLHKVIEGWETIRGQKNLLTRILSIALISSLFFAIKMLIAYHFLGFNITIFQTLFISSMVQLSDFVSITPSNIGIKEAITGLVSWMIGSGFEEGLIVSLLLRAIAYLIFLVMGGICSIWIFKDLNTYIQGE